MKVVINRCYGGFNLSEEAIDMFFELEGSTRPKHWFSTDTDRHNPNLVKVVETLGNRANGFCSRLEIIEIPDDIDYEIEEYDGIEWVSEKHRKWC